LSEPQQYPFALPIGTQISGYEIVRVLGVGGFGITYEGFNPVTRRRAAIKEFFPRGIASRENATQVVFSRQDTDVVTWALDRFQRSTTELCEFQHPNIVSVLNYVPANETGYMFMEQVEGETLEQWLRRKDVSLKFEEMQNVIAPICDALEYVHAKKFIHRDIAPDNIMIRKDGRPMLIDFGAIKIIAQTAQTRAASGRSYGVAKQHYSPPEQMDEDAELDPRADVYALGAVLYRAVSGHPPVDAEKRKNDLILKGADSYVSVAQTARIPLSQQVIDIIDRSLSLKPAQRPSSIAEFRAGLRGEDAKTAVVAPSKPVKVQPMPTPGFSGPGAKPAAESLGAGAGSAASASAPPMLAKSPKSWIGIAAVVTVILIVIGVFTASMFSPQSTTTTTNNNQQQQQQQQQKQQTTTGNPRTALERAEKLAAENRTNEAIAAYSEALRLAGSDTQIRLAALKGRAQRYGILSQYSEQIADLTDVIRFEPNNAQNYSARGTAFWFAKEYDRAISDQTRAIQLDTRNANYYAERGRTNLWKKDYISAIADYSDAIRLEPQPYSLRGRSDSYVGHAEANPSTRVDYLNRAKADLDRVIRDGKGVTAEDYEKRGLIFEKLGNRIEALADFRAALARDSSRSISRQAIQRLGG
jgi:serine/threonine protein kinase